MEFRLVFDTIPDAFDCYRPHYPAIVYQTLFPYAHLTPGSAVLELGPGTGQATRPVLDTGCAYWGNIWRTGSPETFRITRIST